jgi:hypothetical protein
MTETTSDAGKHFDRDEKNRYEQQKREFFNACTAERNRFVEAKAEESKAYDKTVLTFSAGAIGVSLTFVEKIAPEPSVPFVLYVSWSCFALAILAVIVSFLLSQAAMDREIEWIDDAWSAVNAGKTEHPPRVTNRHALLTRGVNLTSGGLFVAGIISLVLFGSQNWPRRSETRSMESKPLRIEITGEIMPNRVATITTQTTSTDTRGNTPAAALLPSAPHLPATTAPAPTVTTTPTTTTNK